MRQVYQFDLGGAHDQGSVSGGAGVRRMAVAFTRAVSDWPAARPRSSLAQAVTRASRGKPVSSLTRTRGPSGSRARIRAARRLRADPWGGASRSRVTPSGRMVAWAHSWRPAKSGAQ